MTYYAKGETQSGDSYQYYGLVRHVGRNGLWTFTIDFKGHPDKMDHYGQIEVHGDEAEAKELRNRILKFLRETQP